MEPDFMQKYFNKRQVVKDYLDASLFIGLWDSEKEIIQKYFNDKNNSVLDLGCGAGRIAMGLYQLGYKNIQGIDFCKNMIKSAIQISKQQGLNISFHEGDATQLTLPNHSFDYIIFGFNGLMQIPSWNNKSKALSEIHRVLKDNGRFIFTTHDREANDNKQKQRYQYWSKEKFLWEKGFQEPRLDDFGDIFYDTNQGKLYIHIPTQYEILTKLDASGFKLIDTYLRSDHWNESHAVEEFSDNCRFWIVEKK